MATYKLYVRPIADRDVGFHATVDDDNRWTVHDPDELIPLMPALKTERERMQFWQDVFLPLETTIYLDEADYSPYRSGRYAKALIIGYPRSEILGYEGIQEPKEMMVY